MMENTLIRRRQGRAVFWRMVIMALLLLTLHTTLYLAEPFSTFTNNLLSNFITIGAAALSAVLATSTAGKYEPSDEPRRIWGWFALALWGWTIGEIVWAAYNMMVGAVTITFGDLFWVASYALFLLALLAQYWLVFQPTARRMVGWIVAWVASILILTLLLAWLLTAFTGEEWGLPLLLAAFYPAGDLVIAMAALRIVHRFQVGALSYPWLGLFAFALVDLLYGVLEMSGAYTWSIENGNLLSTVADVGYVAAYLFVALGSYAQLLLLRYGPIFGSYRYRKETG